MITSLLLITGMTCNACVQRVGDAVRALPGVFAVEVNLIAQQAKVIHDPAQAPMPLLVAAVAGAGYEGAPA